MAATTASTRKISLETMGAILPKRRRLATMRRAINTMLAVNQGKRRALSRPSSTTRSTSNAANVSVQRIWTAEKPKFKCIGTLSGLASVFARRPFSV